MTIEAPTPRSAFDWLADLAETIERLSRFGHVERSASTVTPRRVRLASSAAQAPGSISGAVRSVPGGSSAFVSVSVGCLFNSPSLAPLCAP